MIADEEQVPFHAGSLDLVCNKNALKDLQQFNVVWLLTVIHHPWKRNTIIIWFNLLFFWNIS